MFESSGAAVRAALQSDDGFFVKADIESTSSAVVGSSFQIF